MIDAAVLIPIYRARDGELRIVMIRRNPGGVHGGQIGFPSGKHEPVDETMLDTALRETREDLGLIVPKENILAELPMEQTRTTGYRVFPYLGRITPREKWQIAEREIADIIDVRLCDLADPKSHNRMIERFPSWEKAERVPYYLSGTHRLWGLSCRILHLVIPRLVAGEWDV